MDDLTRAMLILGGYFAPYTSEPGSEHDSSIVMFEIPYPLYSRIIDFGRWAVPDMELYTDYANNIPGREYDQHITIKYGLETNNPLDVLDVIEQRRITPFEIELRQVYLFEKDLYDVVMIEVAETGLTMLHQAFMTDLPNEETYPEYHPHITLAYVTKGMGQAHIGAADFDGFKIYVDRVTFGSKDRHKTIIPLYQVQL